MSRLAPSLCTFILVVLECFVRVTLPPRRTCISRRVCRHLCGATRRRGGGQGLRVRLHDSLDDAVLHALEPLVHQAHVFGPWRGLARRHLVDAHVPRPLAVLARRFLARAANLFSTTRNARQRQPLAFLPGLGFQLDPRRRSPPPGCLVGAIHVAVFAVVFVGAALFAVTGPERLGKLVDWRICRRAGAGCLAASVLARGCRPCAVPWIYCSDKSMGLVIMASHGSDG